jgi:hypothetical protein
MLRRYTPEFLNVLKLNAAPAAQRVLDAITVLNGMKARGSRKMPEGAPTTFVKPRWKPLVIFNDRSRSGYRHNFRPPKPSSLESCARKPSPVPPLHSH